MEEIDIDHDTPISDLIEKIKNKSKDKDEISFSLLLDTFGSRTFAPILFIPSVLLLTPLGAIPGVPTFVGVFIVLVATQLTFGMKHPWVPKKIDNLSVKRNKLISSFEKIQKPVDIIEKIIKPRIKFLTAKSTQSIYGLVIALLGLCMIPLELIPLAVFLPAIAICLISLALLARDGLLAIFSIIFISIIIYLLSTSF